MYCPTSPTICPGGFGKWAPFGESIDIHVQHPISTFFYLYCWFDIAWEVSRIIATMIRMSFGRRRGPTVLDPLFWMILQVVFYVIYKLGLKGIDERAVVKRIYQYLPYIGLFRKLSVLIFVIAAANNMVAVNGLESENLWTFGQIFAMINMRSLLSVLLSRSGCLPSGLILEAGVLDFFRCGMNSLVNCLEHSVF